MDNQLLQKSTLKHEAIPFNSIKESDFLPALKQSIKYAEEKIEKEYLSSSEVSFESVIEKLDEYTENIDYITSIFYALHSAHSTDELRDISNEFSLLLTQFSNGITLNDKIFSRVKDLFEKKDSLSLTREQIVILEKTYSDFSRNGALLNEEDKNKLRSINEESSKLSLKFSDNVLQSGNELKFHVAEDEDLSGVPEYLLKQASLRAKELNKSGYTFTMDYPELLPFLKLCKNRKLRQSYYEIDSKKASEGEFENFSVVEEIVKLRLKRAKLLGYNTHADYVLEKRMAEKPEGVLNFLKEVQERSLEFAQNDFKKLENLAKNDGVDILEPWDVSFYSEILKEKELNFSDEILRPYFSLDKVKEGAFLVANKLYGLKFSKLSDASVYHEDVEVFEVHDDKSNFIGLLYADFFPRATKRPGAWMTNFREQGLFAGKVRRPHVAIVCNFTKPTEDKPSLLAFHEVLTLFHEFGHALHGLLSDCHYRTLSGTNVYWDFVELPSQIMENWIKEKECLDLFAEHFETGEKIPNEIIEKIKKSNQFMEGYSTFRQLSFAGLDMAWHNMSEIPSNIDVQDFEKNALSPFNLFKNPSNTFRSKTFGHLFAGGYSAGYYSYKWAEVLDADAFKHFKDNGIFNRDIGDSFRENILSKGGTEHPKVLYKKFRGKDANLDALFERAGFLT